MLKRRHDGDLIRSAQAPNTARPAPGQEARDMHTPAFEVAKICGKPQRLAKGAYKCLCPAHADHNPSLSVRDGDGALLVRCFAGCDPRDVLAALRGIGITTGGPYRKDLTRPRVTRPPCPAPDDTAAIERRIEAALKIWDDAQDLRGTIAEAYLRGRGLDVLVGSDVARFHPACPRGQGAGGAKGGHQPALICLMRDIKTDKPVAIHRRYLRDDGTRDGKPFTFGRLPGSAIKVTSQRETFADDLSHCPTLHICEGFETALGALMLGYRPLWALGGAASLSCFPVLFGVGELVVLADHDLHDVGIHAAHDAIDRWQAAGKKARGLWPKIAGFDFADVAENLRGETDDGS
jgi:putative DNA primase/helicase